MNIFDQRIKELQTCLIKDNIKAYILPCTDSHLSEEACEHFTYPRFYFCAFKGNDGTLLVTQEKCYLYTDGRYWVEAEEELKDTNCELVKAGKPGVPSMTQFIKDNNLYPLGMDCSLCSLDELQSYYVDDNHPIKSISYNHLIEDLPSLPRYKIWKVDPKLLSTTMEERVRQCLNYASSYQAESIVLTALDDISYLLGYRGKDIPCTPVFYSYLFINKDGYLDLFINPEKLPDDFKEAKVRIHPYEDFYDFLEKHEEKILVDYNRTNALALNKIKHPINRRSPAYLFKAIKGPVEIENTKKVHEIDGIAVLRLQKFIEDHIDEGLDEFKCAAYLDTIRRSHPLCFDLSFTTIAACDSNAAMMHYAPTREDHAPLTRENQLLLVDSGGQYYGGTTDITRTFLVNRHPSAEVIHDYTLTLKSQIAMSKLIFEQGCSGHSLDLAAREIMWREGLDYKCGTGHGVSYMGPVHEGPIGFRYYTRPGVIDDAVLTPGHIITIEPGVYKDHIHGIRLENELLVTEAFENSQGIFYKFETITYCPYDRRGIDITMLDDEELRWLNSYLQMTYEKLSPYLQEEPELLAYLKTLCEPFKR